MLTKTSVILSSLIVLSGCVTGGGSTRGVPPVSAETTKPVTAVHLEGHRSARAVGAPFDAERANRLLTHESGRGNALARSDRGVLGAETGAFGLTAVRDLEAAALGGSATASYNLGLMREVGFRVRRDPREAARHMRAAADLGYVPAIEKLSAYYAAGFGVTPDGSEAARLAALASERPSGPLPVAVAGGDPSAAFVLATQKLEVSNPARDPQGGARLLGSAARAGHPASALRLGTLYATGDGVPYDLVSAYAWTNVASADRGSVGQAARKRIAELGSHMSRSEIGKAQALTRELARSAR